MHTWGKTFKRIPDEWRKLYISHRTDEQIRQDLAVLFDRAHDLKLKLWALTFVTGIEGAIIGWLATALLDCVEAGHKAASLIR